MSPGIGARTSRIALAGIWALAVTGCTTPVRLGATTLTAPRAPDPSAEDGPERPRPAPGAASVWIGAVEDRRSDKTFGSVAGREVTLTELGQWLDHELAEIASSAFVVVREPAQSGPAKLVLRPHILKAYVSGVGVTKTAVIVLGVEFVPPGGSAAVRIYRGQHASMNWASGEGEVVSALRDAAAVCVEQLRKDIEAALREAERGA